ncbi:thiolase family protein [Psychromonas sp. RZ22]|uniref:thiolase family protein n=1 Tax=Psychromonas algarum TaxID=2555643 RepID=UPI0010689B9F|nr:thiolase family protein [Psychromonas sp. RZ22]TEW54167.1 thiolase family protein [Psychromonas sp. RZ22]
MKERLAIIEGGRSPFCKAGTDFKGMQADQLGAVVVRELMANSVLNYQDVDEVIIGNVAQPGHAANIARVIALQGGFPVETSAYTVNRNCASGMESMTTAANKIFAGEIKTAVVGGSESMSSIPLLYGPKMTQFFMHMMMAKTPAAKLKVLSQFRLSFLKPIIGIELGLTDPVCGLNMGETAEVLAREFSITREEQDKFALNSHQLAIKAQQAGKFADEIISVASAPKYQHMQHLDNGPRDGQTLEALAKLRPYFDRLAGSVTVGNACPITDGAVAFTVMAESQAKAMGLTPLGYLRDYSYAGLAGNRMGLGPVYATAKLIEKSGLAMTDFDLIELNEAFAVQVIANQRAFDSKQFAEQYLQKSQAIGELDPSKLNINGGAIALGHPVGATGGRLILTLLHELKRQGLQRGLATLCIGGGQGAALVLEVE